jgi:hypothetical protein
VLEFIAKFINAGGGFITLDRLTAGFCIDYERIIVTKRANRDTNMAGFMRLFANWIYAKKA